MKTLLLMGIAVVLYATSYESYVAMLKKDPSLQMLEHQQRALYSNAREQSLLDDPQLILGIDNMPVEDPGFDRYLPTSKVVGIAQKFASGLEEGAALAHSNAEKVSLQTLYRFHQLEADFYASLVTHRLKQNHLRNLTGQQQILDAMKEEINNRLYSGRDLSAELNMVEERELAIASMIVVLESEQKVTENALIRFVNEIPQTDIPDRVLKPWQSDLLFPVLIAMQEDKRAAAASSLARSKDGIDFSLQLLYKQREAGKTFDGEDWVSISGALTIPLWGKKEAAYESALQQRDSASQNIELQRLLWTQKMRDMEVRYHQIQERMRLMRRRIQTIEETVRAQQERYDVGHGRYFDVLESKLRLMDAAYTLHSMQAELSILAANQNSQIKD